MASAAIPQLVSVEEYLNTTYEHDVDFVDGVLEERGMPTLPHSLLQLILGLFFREFERQMRYKVVPEWRTQIVAGSRYRVPDIVICPRPVPERICNVVPLGIVEILSPDDSIRRTRIRFRDYASIGVQHLILLDPEECVAFRYDNGSLIETVFTSLELPGGVVPFDSARIFEQLRAELEEE